MNKPLIERAYELAHTGEFVHFTPLKKALRVEGYNVNELCGAGLIRSLVLACKLARGEPSNAPKSVKRPLTAEERSASARRGAATRLALQNNRTMDVDG